MGFGETRTANQRNWDIKNFARHLMREITLVEKWQGEKKEEKLSGLKEIKSVHNGCLD